MRLNTFAIVFVGIMAFSNDVLSCSSSSSSFVPTKSSVEAMIVSGEIHSADPWDNTGWYEWDAELGKAVLVASWFDPNLLSTPVEVRPGDVVELALPRNDEHDINSSCTPLPQIPAVIVETSLPRFSVNMANFVRRSGFSPSGGAVTVTRLSFVRPAALPAPAPCNSEPTVREQAASIAVRESISDGLCAANRVTPRTRGPGTRWSVSFPGGSEPGIYEWATNAECRASTFVLEITPPRC